MKHKVAVTVNGRKHEHEVEPRLLLVHYLRDVVGLTGTHIGCDTSQCGACTIHVDGQAVKSCTMMVQAPHWLRDRKSTRLNSSHRQNSYAGFCLEKKRRLDRQPRL